MNITRIPSLNQHLCAASPEPVSYDVARHAWYEFRAAHGHRTPVAPYMSEPNQKIVKNQIPTISFTGNPARTSGLNACTASTPQCRAMCIRYTGRLDLPKSQAVADTRMRFLAAHPDEACSLIYWETFRFARKHAGNVGRRLNVVTDLRWEDFAPWLFEWSMPDVLNYDYTKHWDRDRMPFPNYRLTFSATERHTPDDIRVQVDTGANVAVVFPHTHKETGYPETWHGMPLINGDVDDWRFGDPEGVVVALYAKGRARKAPVGWDKFVKEIR